MDDTARGTAATAKAALRAGVRVARRALGDGERAHLDAALARTALVAGRPLAALPAGSVVAAYASVPTEPGTRALRAALAARGLVVVLPVVGGGGPLAWEVDPGPGAEGRGAAFEGGLGAVAVVLLPALAADRSGTRLGQGGGHYDRTLASLASLAPLPALSRESAVLDPPGGALSAESASRRGPLLVAVVREAELLPAGALPREPHDATVDAALTPSGWHDLG